MIDFTLYQSYRDGLLCPAHLALHWVREQERLVCWIATVGFHWQADHHGNQMARWSQDGFELQATLVTDPDGWWSIGTETYGVFSMHWAPGAIRHSDGHGRECEWFIPADPDPDHGRQSYRRACDYGSGWGYLHLGVSARRVGIELGSAVLCGIESDSGEDYFTMVARDLAAEAVSGAVAALDRLCRAA